MMHYKPIYCAVALLLCFWISFHGIAKAEATNADDQAAIFPQAVSISAGPVEGETGDVSLYFKGIPYAAPPVGSLRWQPPADVQPWTDVLAADEFACACPQYFSLTGDDVVWSEDCLYLNVYRPKSEAASLPVMVFFHGGGLIFGSASEPYYDGEWLAQHKNVVLVTVNYRLGPFGYLYVPEYGIGGNYGLLDQMKALEWVQENIASFGGNPDNVTVFGESSGALSVALLLGLVPELFHKAIIQSGWIYQRRYIMSAESANKQGNRLLEEIGCGNPDDAEECLRQKPPEDILSAVYEPDEVSSGRYSFGPVLDKTVITDVPFKLIIQGRGKEIPLIMGVNSDEGTLFSYFIGIENEADYEDWLWATFGFFASPMLRHYPAGEYEEPWLAAADIMGDLIFSCPTRNILKKMAWFNSNVYHYRFTFVPTTGQEPPFLGAFHGSEIAYLFRSFPPESPAAEAVSDNITELWTTFARSGTPSCGDIQWKPFNPFSQHYLIIDSELTMERYPEKEHCDFWDRLIKPFYP
jgi:para-nitrobenzyl esterase